MGQISMQISIYRSERMTKKHLGFCAFFADTEICTNHQLIDK